MAIAETTVHLRNTENYVTDEPKDAFLVVSGTVDVYIAPLVGGKSGRRVLLCQAQEGTVIPSFSYRDRDYQRWHFVLVARQDTELKCLPTSVTSVLLAKFSQRVGLIGCEEEGFENSIVEYYKRESVKDDVFIERSRQQIPKEQAASYSAIRGAFDNDGGYIEGDSVLYKAVVYACRAMKQENVPYEKVTNICGKRMDIPNIAQASNLICRPIVLESDWFHHDCGVLIGTIEEDTVVCVPKGHGYQIFYPATEGKKHLSKAVAMQIDPQAYSLARALPAHKLTKKDIMTYGKKELSKSDLWFIVLLGLMCTMLGVLLPTINQKIYDDYIPLGNYSELIQICVVMGAAMLGNLSFSIVKSLCEFRLHSRVGYRIQDAAYYRLFRLSENFFHKYDSADLAQRLMSIGPTVNRYIQAVVITGISTIFSLLYLVRMFKYSSKLTWVAALMILVYTAIMVPISLAEVRYEQKETENLGKSSAKLYQYLSGIEKIRMAGAEECAIHDYMIPFSEIQSTEICKNRLSNLLVVLSGIASTVFSMILYYIMVKSKLGISVGSFVGFNTAFGTFSGAIQKMVDSLLGVYQLRPTFDRFKPVFETACESDGESELPGSITGDISIQHVSFAYGDKQKPVLRDICLDIHPGEYIGIVGTSGCGKSTLLKLLLGFEVPDGGQIFYDGQDLRTLDKQALRKNLGVVLQNGKLIAGSIYENITITAPEATMTDVKSVLEAVGLKEDVAHMPMGVQTVLSESSGTISGGQQQRIMIARAIIGKPAVLIFDEATSALDNLTQAVVCESLDKMNVTRIVVAHRLSTIRTCDRIVVLQDGSVAEEGNYETLMNNKGLFYQLASRQIAE